MGMVTPVPGPGKSRNVLSCLGGFKILKRKDKSPPKEKDGRRRFLTTTLARLLVVERRQARHRGLDTRGRSPGTECLWRIWQCSCPRWRLMGEGVWNHTMTIKQNRIKVETLCFFSVCLVPDVGGQMRPSVFYFLWAKPTFLFVYTYILLCMAVWTQAGITSV